MKTGRARDLSLRATCLLLAGGLCAAPAMTLAQSTAPAITTLTTVDVTQSGKPPSGPYPVIVEHDPGLPTHTIYRPKELGSSRHSVLVWGEGACAKNGLMFPEFLSEIASYGFVIIADGPPGATRPPPAGAPAGPPRGPSGPTLVPDGTDLIKAVDWLEKEAAKPGSRFNNKVDVKRVAAMGMSCGGVMSYGASADPRIATVGIWNSGLIQPDQKIYDGIHSPVIIITGGESDIAYANGKRDFEVMPAKVPVFYGVHPSVGHGGTYNEDNGGAFGVAAVAWLKWQLQGDKGASGRGYFTGSDCGICKDTKWLTQSRALP